MSTPTSPVVHLYHQIYLILREEFVDGKRTGHPLPGELDLARRFKVSRITMRKALEKLVAEGLIYRQRGLGSFVAERGPARTANTQGGLLDNIISMAAKTKIRLLSVQRLSPAPDVAAPLELAKDEGVVKVVRLRSLRDEPLSHITTYVPDRFAECLFPEALSATPMLSLLEQHGVKVVAAQQTITARLADSVVAPLLETDVGAPLLAVSRLVRDADGRPVQLLYGLYRPDRYQYRMNLSRTASGEASIWYQQEAVGADTS